MTLLSNSCQRFSLTDSKSLRFRVKNVQWAVNRVSCRVLSQHRPVIWSPVCQWQCKKKSLQSLGPRSQPRHKIIHFTGILMLVNKADRSWQHAELQMILVCWVTANLFPLTACKQRRHIRSSSPPGFLHTAQAQCCPLLFTVLLNSLI